jgi:hypothetical protein
VELGKAIAKALEVSFELPELWVGRTCWVERWDLDHDPRFHTPCDCEKDETIVAGCSEAALSCGVSIAPDGSEPRPAAPHPRPTEILNGRLVAYRGKLRPWTLDADLREAVQ